METFKARTCPYCGILLVKYPYWRHIEQEHNEQYNTDKNTWIQLFKDYSAMGMDPNTCVQVIAELFNQSSDFIMEFLKDHKVL
jgi:uncharacterized C2H2 Zn-finger protein